MIVFTGCATTEDLGRSYGVLNERLDAAEKRLAVLMSQQTANLRQDSLTEYARLGKELRDLRVQSVEDIEINRREIKAAATIADLKRLEDKTGQLVDSLETKTDASLDGRIQTVKHEIIALGKNQAEIQSRLEKLSADMSSDLRKSKVAIDADIEKTKVEIDQARREIERNMAQTDRSRQEIQAAGREIEKHKAEIEYMRGAIEAGSLELKQNRQEFQFAGREIEKHKAEIEYMRGAIEAGSLELKQNRLELERNITETEKNKAELRLIALESAKIHADLESTKNESERVKRELNSLINETAASRAALTESRALIEKGETEIKKVGQELMISKSAGADTIADITDLREKLLQINGLMEAFQRNQTIIQRDQALIQKDQALIQRDQEIFRETLAGKIDTEKKLTAEYESATEKINQNVRAIDDVRKFLGLEKEPGPGRDARPGTDLKSAPAKELPFGGKTIENLSVESLYEEAYNSYKGGKYDKARQEFQELLKRIPGGGMAEHSRFWIAESFFQEKQYERAIVEYAEVIAEHGSGSKRPLALLKQGLSYLALGNKENAKATFEIILMDHPHSTQARIARSRLIETN